MSVFKVCTARFFFLLFLLTLFSQKISFLNIGYHLSTYFLQINCRVACYIISSYIKSYRITSYIVYRIISYHILYYIILYYIILYYIILYKKYASSMFRPDMQFQDASLQTVYYKNFLNQCTNIRWSWLIKTDQCPTGKSYPRL